MAGAQFNAGFAAGKKQGFAISAELCRTEGKESYRTKKGGGKVRPAPKKKAAKKKATKRKK